MFLIQVYLGSKLCPQLESAGLRLSARYIRDCVLLNVCSSSKRCTSAGCASAANVVCKGVNIFGTKTVSVNHIL